MQISGFCEQKVNTPDLMECGVNRMDKRVTADFTSGSFLKGHSQGELAIFALFTTGIRK